MMRNTKQRKIVFDIINNSYNHPTAYMVYQECVKILPNISLGTVYRNLNLLVSNGDIQRLDLPNQVVRYDKCISHDHFICTSCGKVIDLSRSNLFYDNMIDGNMITDYIVRYDGICCDCLIDKKGDDINGTKRK